MLPDGSHESFQRRFVGLGEVLSRRPDAYQLLAEAFLREGTAPLAEAKETDDDEEAP